jgi:hypothetical protein
MKLDRFKFARLVQYITNLNHQEWLDLNELDKLTEMDVEPVKTDKVPCELVDELLKRMLLGDKIPAIKAYRVLTGAGLKESKDAVEQYWLNQSPPVNFDKFEG